MQLKALALEALKSAHPKDPNLLNTHKVLQNSSDGSSFLKENDRDTSRSTGVSKATSFFFYRETPSAAS
jgi:hypothetical protein